MKLNARANEFGTEKGVMIPSKKCGVLNPTQSIQCTTQKDQLDSITFIYELPQAKPG